MLKLAVVCFKAIFPSNFLKALTILSVAATVPASEEKPVNVLPITEEFLIVGNDAVPSKSPANCMIPFVVVVASGTTPLLPIAFQVSPVVPIVKAVSYGIFELA